MHFIRSLKLISLQKQSLKFTAKVHCLVFTGILHIGTYYNKVLLNELFIEQNIVLFCIVLINVVVQFLFV